MQRRGQPLFNIKRDIPHDMRRLIGNPNNIRQNLFSYIQGFSPAVRDVFERLKTLEQAAIGSAKKTRKSAVE